MRGATPGRPIFELRAGRGPPDAGQPVPGRGRAGVLGNRALLLDRHQDLITSETIDDAGVATFPGMKPGNYIARIELPDGSFADERFFLSSRESWVVEIAVDLEPSSGLEVRVRGDEPLPKGLQVRSMTELADSRSRERRAPIVQGRCLIPGPFGTEVSLELRDGNLRILNVAHLSQGGLRSGHVELPLVWTQLPFRTVSRDGTPIQRATVMLVVPESRSGCASLDYSDAQGRISLHAPPDVPLLMQIRLAGGGGMPDVAIDRGMDRELEREIVVDVDGTVEVRYSDSGTPLATLNSSLISSSGFRIECLQLSDPAGRTRSGPLTPGAYTLEVSGVGVWPTQVPVEVGFEPVRMDVTVRRLGALELAVRGAEGLGVPGVRVSLESEEFGGSVDRWIDEGRIP